MLQSSAQNYQLQKVIGEGSYGKVYKAIRRSDGEVVAIKLVNITRMDSITIQNTLNEIRILHSVNSKHIVGYHEAFLDSSETHLWIVMEYVGGGDLAYAIQLARAENKLFPEPIVWRYLIQALRAITILNKLKIIHRDIKPANLFITDDMETVKLGDLNVATVVKSDLSCSQVGTPNYLAPEIWENKSYDVRCDVFSLGCCIYEMVALKVPFEAKTMDELKVKIRKGLFPTLPGKYSEELKVIISKCLTKNPIQRPTAEKLLTLPAVITKIHAYDLEDFEDRKSKLVDPIILPRNLSILNSKLPRKKYTIPGPYSVRTVPVEENTPSPFFEFIQNKKEEKNDLGNILDNLVQQMQLYENPSLNIDGQNEQVVDFSNRIDVNDFVPQIAPTDQRDNFEQLFTKKHNKGSSNQLIKPEEKSVKELLIDNFLSDSINSLNKPHSSHKANDEKCVQQEDNLELIPKSIVKKTKVDDLIDEFLFAQEKKPSPIIINSIASKQVTSKTTQKQPIVSQKPLLAKNNPQPMNSKEQISSAPKPMKIKDVKLHSKIQKNNDIPQEMIQSPKSRSHLKQGKNIPANQSQNGKGLASSRNLAHRPSSREKSHTSENKPTWNTSMRAIKPPATTSKVLANSERAVKDCPRNVRKPPIKLANIPEAHQTKELIHLPPKYSQSQMLDTKVYHDEEDTNEILLDNLPMCEERVLKFDDFIKHFQGNEKPSQSHSHRSLRTKVGGMSSVRKLNSSVRSIK